MRDGVYSSSALVRNCRPRILVPALYLVAAARHYYHRRLERRDGQRRGRRMVQLDGRPIPLPITGRFWGVRQSIITVASLAGLVAAGQILDVARNPATGQATGRGFAVVFLIAAIVGVADILVHTFVREPRPVPTPRGSAIFRRILAPLANRNFRLLTLSLGVWNFGLAMISSFALVYLKRDFDVSYSQLAALTIAAALGAIVTGYGFGHMLDRVSARRLGALLYVATPLSLAPGSLSITRRFD